MKRRKIGDDPVAMDIVPIARRRFVVSRYSGGIRRRTAWRWPRSRIPRGIPLRAGGWTKPSRTEFKYVDTAVNVATNTGNAVLLLNAVAEGTGPSDRVGRQYRTVSIQCKLRNYVTAGTGTDQVHRIVIVYDRQPNGAAIIADTVYGAAPTPQSMKDMNQRQRFLILLDKVIQLNATGEPGSDTTWEFYRRVSLGTTCNAAAAPIANISTGSIYMIFMGSNVAGATAGTTYGNVRIRFVDV